MLLLPRYKFNEHGRMRNTCTCDANIELSPKGVKRIIKLDGIVDKDEDG